MIGYHDLNYLTEKVYTVNDSYSKDDINYELSSFFSDLMSRRRDDQEELGLQAGGVIYPDKAGFKISERDGNASHSHTHETISQYLNGETSFSGEETIGMLGSRMSDPNAWMNIPKNGFVVRIVASKDALIFVFNTYSYEVTDFQLDVISNMFNHIKEAYQNNEIQYPYINYVTANKRFVFDEDADIDEQLNALEKVITDEKKSTKKTR